MPCLRLTDANTGNKHGEDVIEKKVESPEEEFW